MKTLTIGDHVRVKATGEVMVVDDKLSLPSGSILTLSKWGHMSGGLNIHPDRLEVKREDVVKVDLVAEWVDDED